MAPNDNPSSVLIGCGAGFSGDRVDASQAVVAHLARRDARSFLMIETLGERTLALAQRARRADPDKGFEPRLDQIARPVLPTCLEAGIPVVGNFGAANPRAAAERLRAIAREEGCRDPRIAVVLGDDIRARLEEIELSPWEGSAEGYLLDHDRVVAANAYLGARPIAEALDRGADIVVTGRVADPALALGPLLHAFGWRPDAWDLLAAGTMAGHLLECGSQVTGGYFADPGRKDVPGMATLGFPVAEIHSDGRVFVTKAEGTGGAVTVATGREQLLYEVHDPSAYVTPDVVADISAAEIRDAGENRIELAGVRGHPATSSYKATISLAGGLLGEAEISYAGSNARARAELAADIVRERMRIRKLDLRHRIDLIGVSSVFDSDAGDLRRSSADDPADIRLRLAVEGHCRDEVEAATQEVLALLCCGPAGGGGFRRHHVERLHTASFLIDKAEIRPEVEFV